MAEKVAIDKAIPIMINPKTAVIIEIFSFAVNYSPRKWLGSLSLCYCVLATPASFLNL
jgi:hypothetical protein